MRVAIPAKDLLRHVTVTKTHPFALAFALAATAAPVAAQDLPPYIRLSAACAPVATGRPGDAHRIVGSTNPSPKTLYSAGEQVVINAGTERGVQIGQRYFVRRPLAFPGAPRGEDTMGWVRIIAATESTAIATVEFACNGISTGEHLEPYAEPVLPPGIDRTDASGELDFSKTARVLYGENGRGTGGGRDFMIADMGQEQGVAPGARFAIYRDLKIDDVPPVLFGEAIVVSTLEERSLIRVTSARDAVTTGDTLVARIGGTGDAAAARNGAAGQQPGGGGGEGNVPGGGAGGTGGAVTATREPLRSLTFEDVYFDFDRYTLRAEALTMLDSAVKSLADSPTLRIQIEGHTCNIGTTEYNLALGERRAGAVRDYLISRGVAANRLSTVSFGEERPKYENAKEETRRLNRRAVLTVNIQQ
jgi:peptidoglycan-associated lipoprotein